MSHYSEPDCDDCGEKISACVCDYCDVCGELLEDCICDDPEEYE